MIGSGDKRRLRPDVIALDTAGNRVFDITKAARERNPAANAYRILTPDQVMEVAFGPAEKRLPQTTIRKRRLDAINAVRHLANANYCTIEEAGGGYRILPPPTAGVQDSILDYIPGNALQCKAGIPHMPIRV